MLRITRTDAEPENALLRLEGNLMGAWNAELQSVCEPLLAESRQLTLDLTEVSLIDRTVLDLLVSHSSRTATLAGCSPFQQEELKHAAALHQPNLIGEP